MKISGSIYKKGNEAYLALYSGQKDFYRKEPPCLTGKSQYVGHITYSYGNTQPRAIDIYLIKGDLLNFPELQKEVGIQREIRIHGEDLSYLDKQQGINYNLVTDIKNTESERTIINCARKDVGIYCREHNKNPAVCNKTESTYVREIFPITKIPRFIPENYLKSGKQDFVDVCLFDGNIDSSRLCFSCFVPDLNKGARINNDSLSGYYLDFFSLCEYCYAGYQQDESLRAIQIDKDKLKEELTQGNFKKADGKIKGGKVKVLRLGKMTEFATPFNLTQLIQIGEVCLDTKTKIVMPTKYLAFNENIAEIFKKTQSKILYSVSNRNDLERGACLNGASNEFRLEQAVKYKEAGADSNIYLQIDATSSPTEKEIQTLAFARKHNLGVQFLPLRLLNRDIAYKITGKTKNELLLYGLYERIGASTILVAKSINSYWNKLVENNHCEKIRMCHHNNLETYCGKCFIFPGTITKTKHVKINYDKKRKPRRSLTSRRRTAIKKSHMDLFG